MPEFLIPHIVSSAGKKIVHTRAMDAPIPIVAIKHCNGLTLLLQADSVYEHFAC